MARELTPTTPVELNRALIVEDDDDLAQLLQAEITEIGLATRAVGDAERAASEIRAWTPDVVISDLRLPGSDGLALLRHSRKISPIPSFIVITRDFHFGHPDAGGVVGLELRRHGFLFSLCRVGLCSFSAWARLGQSAVFTASFRLWRAASATRLRLRLPQPWTLTCRSSPRHPPGAGSARSLASSSPNSCRLRRPSASSSQ